ncbi:MAG TPA: cytochrome-c oxidase, cbb3-type subunit I [Verrucomicrobiae bacterium]|nr:cytochrome-c oxidase, cbb3-type subunit I [Verrucomicrobiae bacterium]
MDTGGGKATIEYDDAITRMFLIAGILWGAVGMAAGVFIASQLAFWQMNLDLPWLTFGRLRPLHTNAAIFAFVGNMMFAGIYYSTQRLVKAALPSRLLARVHFWLWQAIIVAAAITLPLGLTRGKEYAELIWPIDIAVAVAWVIFAINFFWTLARRNEPSLYVAVWFYIATIVTVTVLYVVNHLQIPTGLLHGYPIFGGVQDALVQWWYGHNAVAFFLTTPILGIMYYYLPKAAGRPVYSYRLSVVHFWSLVFIYIWAGPHHLLHTALPDWLQSLGMIFSVMLWAPSWGGMLNGLLTLRGAWDKVREDPVLKFFAAGVTFYGMSTFEGPLLAIKSVNALSHYTDWTIGHVHAGTLGWNGFMAAGMFYWLAPRLWNTRLHSTALANFHFWIGLVGILLYIASMWVSGISHGLMLGATTEGGSVLKYPNFLDAVTANRAMMHTRMLGGMLYLSGWVLLVYNIWRTVASGKPVNGTAEVFVAERRSHRLTLAEALTSTPVMFTAVILACVLLWAIGWDFVKMLALLGLIVAMVVAVDRVESRLQGWGEWYDRLLANSLPFTVLTVFAVLIGGLVEIIPTIVMHKASTLEGVRQIPYTPLQLAGRDIYIREGCYNCHSQMVRPFVGEVLRYGDYSKLGESIYDHPYQWGSKRTGPDLHRVGGKYPHIWHLRHMENPRSVSIGSPMPNYPWLLQNRADLGSLKAKFDVLRTLGVPYPERSQDRLAQEAAAEAKVVADDLGKSGAAVEPDREIIALIAYLQQLGKSEQVPKATTAATAKPMR